MARRKQSTWKDQRHTLEQRRDAVSEITSSYAHETDEALCRLLLELKTEKERLELEQQKVSERTEAISQMLADRWEHPDRNVTSMEVDGITFSLGQRLYVSTQDKEAYHQWLRNNDMEALIQNQVAPKTTESLIRERLENGLPCDEMGLKINYKSTVK